MADERSLNALDVAEKFANGQASEAEIYAAQAAAQAAAWATQREMFVAMLNGTAPWQVKGD